jgi:hypothetical protein
MALWVRNPFYLVQYIGPGTQQVGITLFYNGTVYDWASKTFVQMPNPDPKVQVVQNLAVTTTYTFPGPTQLWEFKIDTSKFADGMYTMFYVAPNGALLTTILQEYFGVYSGSPDGLLPRTVIQIEGNG